ncbi:MAG: transaldolase family protein [Gammaproteobacteria bacterium]
MKLFLDSVDFAEIREAFQLGFLTGLTTTPTFMHRHGITDIDAAIVELSGLVPELQVEALGETHDQIVAEAERLLTLPLKKEPVFKIPISNHGVRACSTLVRKGHRVNVHLVYTLSQAYMAAEAGASYVCPLAGRLQDQGHDAAALIEQCVAMVNRYRYETMVMFSSVRHADHVRQALVAGAHVCTVPWGVMKKLNDNALTELGTAQFFEHTRAMTKRVGEVIDGRNPTCHVSDRIMDALVKMTESRLGAITVVDREDRVIGIMTDGDVRRALQNEGRAVLDMQIESLRSKRPPLTVGPQALLFEAVKLFKEHQVDNIVVAENGKAIGILDIQDLVKVGLIG